jgi:uncharacterized protein (TIGR00251 family)
MKLEVRSHRNGATVRARVRPGAPRTGVVGERAGALRVALAAPPEKGRANRELLRFLAKALRLPRAGLELVGGERSRDKVVLCRGLGPDELRDRLAGLVEPD